MGCASSVQHDALPDELSDEDDLASMNTQRQVTKREAREAFEELCAATAAFKPIQMLKIGQSLKDSVGSSGWKPFADPPRKDDVGRAAATLSYVRDNCGLLRRDGAFLQQAFDLPPRRSGLHPTGSQSDSGIDDPTNFFNIQRLVARSMGLHIDELAECISRVLQCADCLLGSALAGCELMSVMQSADIDLTSIKSPTVVKAVSNTAAKMFAQYLDTWEEIYVRYGLSDEDDVISTFESHLAAIIPQLPPRSFKLATQLRSFVRTAISLLLFAHGGRSNSASFGKYVYETALGKAWLVKLSSIFEAFWLYCAHPSHGMELTRKLGEEADAMISLMAFLGAIPCEIGILDSVSVALTRFLGPAISPAATATVLYIAAVLCTQLRLDIKNINRSTILQQAADALQPVVVRAAQTTGPVSSKVFPTFEDEAGEGHGPRKEFFDLVASSLCSTHTPPMRLRGAVVVDGAKGGSFLHLRPTFPAIMSDIRRHTVPGSILAIGDDDSSVFNATMLTTHGDSDGLGVRISTRLPEDFDGAPLRSLRQPQLQCFAPFSFESQYVWFSEGTLDDIDPAAARLYFLAGWMLGAAIANGVTVNLKMPPVFFKLARQRISGAIYSVCEADLIDVDESYRSMFSKIRTMNVEAFRDYVLSIDEGNNVIVERLTEGSLPSLRETFITEFIVEAALYRRCRKRLDVMIDGFRASLIPVLPVAWAVPTERMQSVVSGTKMDSPTKDFTFSDVFRIYISADFTSTPHGRIYADMILQALDAAHVADASEKVHYKRTLLKFITGRDIIPAHAKAESIFIECGDVCETNAEHAHAIGRLPASHTCSNALHIPNYLEHLAFGADDQASLVTVGHTWRQKVCYVTREMLENNWKKLSAALQQRLQQTSAEMLLAKLTLAATGTDSYELDERDYESDDDDDDARRRSSVMRGIPPPRRRFTVGTMQPNILPRRMTPPGSSPASSFTNGLVVHHERPQASSPEASFEDPCEPCEDSPATMNPFVPPTAESPAPPEDLRKATVAPSSTPQQLAINGHTTSDSDDEPAPSGIALPERDHSKPAHMFDD